MGQFIEDLQYKIKRSSGNILLKIFILLIGLVLGLTFAIAGQQMVGYGTFAYLLVILTATAAFYKIARAWSWGNALVFAFICVLLASMLNMYIQLAPGA